VAGGCIVSGTEIRESLLFSHVHTNSYSILEQAVILPHVTIARHVDLRKCVVDGGVSIPEGLTIGQDPKEDAEFFEVSKSGVTLITQPMVDAWKAAQ